MLIDFLKSVNRDNRAIFVKKKLKNDQKHGIKCFTCVIALFVYISTKQHLIMLLWDLLIENKT